MVGKRAAQEKVNQHQPQHQSQQEGSQVTRSAKNQTNQAKTAAATAAAAATKLERFARTSLLPDQQNHLNQLIQDHQGLRKV